MGYVTDTFDGPFMSLHGKLTSSADPARSWTITGPRQISKSQFGYRSGPLSKIEKESIDTLNATGKWRDTRRQIDALDRIQRATSDSPLCRTDPFTVNRREYTEIEYVPGTYNYDAVWRSGSYVAKFNGMCQFTLQDFSPVGYPDLPSEASLRAEAGGMMRNHRPTKPDVNLTQFVGELREMHDVLKFAVPATRRASFTSLQDPLRVGKYENTPLGDSMRVYAGGYVGLEFGVQPTKGDILRLSEAVLRADDKTRDFIQRSSQLVHRSSVRTIHESSSSSLVTIQGTGQQSRSVISGIVNGVNFTPMQSGVGFNSSGTQTVTVRYRLKAFNTFEYYVGDPGGYTTRMDSYAAKARKLLGGGLTLSTAWELTRFSWLLDWYVDIGGLLAYQQDVADYSLVSRRAGLVVDREINSSLGLQARAYDPIQSCSSSVGISSSTYRTQVRYPASPYGVAASWSDLNGRQWAILGALGLAKAPRIPNLSRG